MFQFADYQLRTVAIIFAVLVFSLCAFPIMIPLGAMGMVSWVWIVLDGAVLAVSSYVFFRATRF